MDPVPSSSVDLSGAWSTFWSAVTASAGAQLTNVLSVLGVAVLVFAVVGYLWQRARNVGGDSSKLVWAVAIGATLAAPGVIFPLMLTLVDVIANAGISVYQATQTPAT
jgi:hypothetical protein